MTVAVAQPLLVLACGALAREIIALTRASHWDRLVVQCLPADLHNRPDKIPAAISARLIELRGRYEQIFVAYADCGTGGRLDAVLAEYGIERLPGAHCYEFFATGPVFAALADAEPGTFYLTDFLVRHFERVVWQGLGLDRHPELLAMYFGNYRQLVYLAQTRRPDFYRQAEQAADRLGLAFSYRYTGYGDLHGKLQQWIHNQ